MIFKNLPIDGPLRITSKFGPRDTGIAGASKYHKGVDIGRDRTKPSTNVIFVADGVVRICDWNDYRGWYVVVDHDEKANYSTLYQHLASKPIFHSGMQVKAGDVVGIMGNSANPQKLKVATHLHFELWHNGKPIDPELYLKGVTDDMTEAETRKVIAETLYPKQQLPSSWATESWKWATNKGIVDGKNPRGALTREQAVVMLERVIKMIKEGE